MVQALQDCITQWQTGTMEVPLFDDDVRAGRAGYAALAGVPVDSVAMGGTVSALLGLVAAAVPDGAGWPPWPVSSPAPLSRSPLRPAVASRSPS